MRRKRKVYRGSKKKKSHLLKVSFKFSVEKEGNQMNIIPSYGPCTFMIITDIRASPASSHHLLLLILLRGLRWWWKLEKSKKYGTWLFLNFKAVLSYFLILNIDFLALLNYYWHITYVNLTYTMWRYGKQMYCKMIAIMKLVSTSISLHNYQFF